jgi:hypothetical protein
MGAGEEILARGLTVKPIWIVFHDELYLAALGTHAQRPKQILADAGLIGEHRLGTILATGVTVVHGPLLKTTV